MIPSIKFLTVKISLENDEIKFKTSNGKEIKIIPYKE